MRRFGSALPMAATLALLCCGVARAQVAPSQSVPQAAANAAPTNGSIAPRTPGGTSVGTAQGDQGKTNSTVGGIDSHLLNAEEDRPRLPGQAPSPSQTLPGGTASGQSPR